MTYDYVSKLKSAATGKNVLVFIIPAFVVYLFMLFYTIPNVQQYAPEMEIFDLSPAGYSYEYSMQLLSALGIVGRDAYLYRQLPLDFIYPGLFAISLCLLMAWVILKGKTHTPAMFYLCLVPIGVGLLDYLENIQIILMIINYPNISENQVAMSSVTTIAKSGLTTIVFIFLVIAFIRVAMARKAG